jgi:peptidoglycan hydrolase-like protein with peptidoglycan-binding domain
MRSLLRKRTQYGWLLVTLAAGACSLPAAATQSAAHSKNHESTTPASAHSTKSSATTGSTAQPAAPKTSPSKKSIKPSGKSSSSKGSRKSNRRVKGQAAPTPERVGEIQQALAKSGAYTDVPSGKWDDSTADAMKRFQASHGLNPTGKLDALTLQKLGFGSETAGLAAPRPPPNATANRLLSRSAQRDEIKNEDEPQ